MLPSRSLMSDEPGPIVFQGLLINLMNPSQARSPGRPFNCFFPATVLPFLRGTFQIITILLIWVCCAYADEETLNDDQARQQCVQGKAIYCLALGIKEEKAGHRERALDLYRTACKTHPSPGHLRACTPLLSLAWKMNRLDEEATPLEALCKDGKPSTCFYLGQEYLKLVEMEKAARHLEPLCRNGFRPPDPANFGPCFHLAKGFEQAGQWDRARELLQFDCERNAEHAQHSCVALNELAEMERIHRELAQKGIRGSDPVEGVLLFLVLMSVLNVWIWFKGGEWGLKYLVWVAPVLVWSGAVTWIYWPDKLEYPASQWAVIYFALLQVSGTAVLGYRALYPQTLPR
jgi:tetratricopeptide (TPR) repeat protein